MRGANSTHPAQRKAPAGSSLSLVTSRTRPHTEVRGGSVMVVRAGPVDPRFLAPPSGCRRCWGPLPGVVASLDPRRPSGTPLGSVVARAAGQQASGGPRGQPFSQPGPAGRAGPTTTCAGPTGQQFLSPPARFVERLARWAERGGGGSHQGLRPWLGERLALWADRRTIRDRKPHVKETHKGTKRRIKGTGPYSHKPGGFYRCLGRVHRANGRPLKSPGATRSLPPDRGLFGCLTDTDAQDGR